MSIKYYFLIFTLLATNCLEASDLIRIRWALPENSRLEFSQILEKLSAEAQFKLNPSDFLVSEERDLSGFKFKMYRQTILNIPYKDAGIRIWWSADGSRLIQVIALLKDPKNEGLSVSIKKLKNKNFESKNALSFKSIEKLVQTDLSKIVNFTSEMVWFQNRLVFDVKVFGKDRMIAYKVDPYQLKVIEKKQRFFPRGDLLPNRQNSVDEYSVAGRAFQMNEEVEMPFGRQKSSFFPEVVELKYLKRSFRSNPINWADQIEKNHFSSKLYDEIKALTPEGQAEGFWSEKSISDMIDKITFVIPSSENSLANGARFVGRYVSVLIHDDAFKKFPVGYPQIYSPNASRSWSKDPNDGWFFKLIPGSYGKTFFSSDELLNRKAPYGLKHDTEKLIQEGFDEMQIYWTVNRWFELMHDVGFLDPELSTRPMTAFLFDPDIESQDNAYYNQDTINFTTYTEKNVNEARNVGTIWHELGHGLMDRLQGASGFDNGGLSEGIADFAAEIALRGFFLKDVPSDMSGRRIANNIGFFLTNEFHDDGEAYGGALKDILEAAIERSVDKTGRLGYLKFNDLVLDAMRLTRNNPNLDLVEWYEALLLADQIGKAQLRQAGEFKELIAQKFSARNFTYQSEKKSSFDLIYSGKSVDESGLGSRYNPVVVKFDSMDENKKQFEVQIKTLLDSSQLQYPVQIKVFFKETNALQGALQFASEEPLSAVLNSNEETVSIPFELNQDCESVNVGDGKSCKDFVYVQLFSNGNKDAFAKKRFYLLNKKD